MILQMSLKLCGKYLPKRKSTDNKTTGGKALIIAGSKGMQGAALLAAEAAARVGAGYVTLASYDDVQAIAKNPDFLSFDLNQDTLMSAKFSAAVIGPGMGLGIRAKETLSELIKLAPKNVVVDADALTLLSQMNTPKIPSSWILTPHTGECERLIQIPSEEIQKNRLKYVKMTAQKYGCLVLLKGYRTLICDGKTTVVIPSGNAALAKAGSGDVLAGMITGFLAQGLSPWQAACVAATIHGYIADEWIDEGKDVLSMRSKDLIELLPLTLKKIRTFSKQKAMPNQL